MKIKTKFKPEMIASRDDTRHVLQSAQLKKHKGRDVLVATDGKRLVVIPIERTEGEDDGPIASEALKLSRAKRLFKSQDTIEIKLTAKTQELENGWIIPREDNGNFPQFEQVIPEQGSIRIAFNPKLLWELCQAMGCPDGVVIYMKDELSPIIAKPNNGDGEFSVLMPLRIH